MQQHVQRIKKLRPHLRFLMGWAVVVVMLFQQQQQHH
jgi:hypothetical protein